MKAGNVRRLLLKLKDEGHVFKADYGKYTALPPGNSGNTGNTSAEEAPTVTTVTGVTGVGREDELDIF